MQLWERQIAPGRAVRDHLKIPQQIPAAISVGQTLLTLCDNLFYTKIICSLCVCFSFICLVCFFRKYITSSLNSLAYLALATIYTASSSDTLNDALRACSYSFILQCQSTRKIHRKQNRINLQINTVF